MELKSLILGQVVMNQNEVSSYYDDLWDPNIADISSALFIQSHCKEGARDVNNIRVTMVIFIWCAQVKVYL